MLDAASTARETVYAVSQFNVFVPTLNEDAILCFNTFSGAFLPVCVEDFEALGGAIAQVEDEGHLDGTESAIIALLVENGFLIPQGFDERAALKQRYFDGRRDEAGLNLTIAPTVSCNFACSYCFEEHPKRHMSEADIEAIAGHVETALQPGEPLSVTWFGGEPLAQFKTLKAIDARLETICRAKGSRYSQSIITNGSLLSEDKIAYFAGREGFSSAQITLDGPADIHDQRRTTSAGGGTFEKILDNIKAVDGRFFISLRVNLDRRNVLRTTELIDLIAEHGLGHYVGPYFGHVTDYNDSVDGLSDHCLSRSEFAEAEIKLGFYMIQRGLKPALGLPQPSAHSLCVADAPGGAVLSPGGLVFSCWNETAFPEQAASGSLGDNGLERSAQQSKKAERWKAYDPFTHAECQSCKVQPLCQGGCLWEAEKAPKDGPGPCSPLRNNLADRLRLHHLCASIDATAGVTPDRPRQVV